MGKYSRSKYIPGYGYIRYIHRSPSIDSINGDGLGDIVSSFFKAGRQLFTKIPSNIIDATKGALVNVGSSTIKAVGSKVGDTIANKIVSKNTKPPPVPNQELRKQILRELTFEQPTQPDTIEPLPTNNKTEANTQGIPGESYKQMYGSGTKRAVSHRKRGQSIIGKGIKYL
jgi:hypothetical protein